ncbi:hypothetical protein B0J13DRAFT_47748 [Dactylonectria estremocensis]|uniref:Uncharacterized protein n=1 Tax=Dactylonectria estremocensis TaxID=1079267 RepID=A0A9P9EUK5_9HYPO|nr:hypothetical protein B0J13DRAFT_47748 [Dactylonectria estremocensis]
MKGKTFQKAMVKWDSHQLSKRTLQVDGDWSGALTQQRCMQLCTACLPLLGFASCAVDRPGFTRFTRACEVVNDPKTVASPFCCARSLLPVLQMGGPKPRPPTTKKGHKDMSKANHPIHHPSSPMLSRQRKVNKRRVHAPVSETRAESQAQGRAVTNRPIGPASTAHCTPSPPYPFSAGYPERQALGGVIHPPLLLIHKFIRGLYPKPIVMSGGLINVTCLARRGFWGLDQLRLTRNRRLS